MVAKAWLFGVIVFWSLSVPDQVWAQDQSGFLNIDCGSTAAYADPVTGIKWVPDGDYITTGTNFANVPNANTFWTEYSELQTLRYFNNSYPKNCYSLPVTPNETYLVRATWYFGSYNGAPEATFLFSIDATVVSNITIDDTSALYQEFTIQAQNAVTFVCVSRDTTRSVPFISAISLRPGLLYYKFPSYLGENRYIKTEGRYNFGGNTIRFPNDTSDRYWSGQDITSPLLQFTPTSNLQAVTAAKPVSSGQLHLNLTVPVEMLETAVTTSGNMTLSYLNNESYTFQDSILALYFAELNPRANLTSREFLIDVPSFSDEYEDPLNTSSDNYYSGSFWYFWGQVFQPNDTVVMFPTGLSTLGPILCGVEIFDVKPPSNLKTIDRDALAIEDIKSHMNLTDWTGDPCLPFPHSWITCTPTAPYQVLTVNLTGYNLNGTMSPSFANLYELTSLIFAQNALIGSIPNLTTLTSLKILQLQDNLMSGPLPDWLASLPDLTELFIQNNNFSGLIPEALQTLAQKNLNFQFSGNPNLENATSIFYPHKRNINIGVIIGCILGGVVVLVVLLSLILFCIFRRRNQNQNQTIITGINVKSNPLNAIIANANGAKAFTLSAIVVATEDFKHEIGRGGFGPVYYGKLSNGQEVAVKVLDNTSRQGESEFINEVDLLSRVHHKNLVSLIGSCQEDNTRMLIYEYLQNGSVRDHLYGNLAKTNVALDWKTRLNIAVNAAQGLDYLHTACIPNIIHRDIKSSNILLAKNLEFAKVADFGLSRLSSEEDETHVTTIIKGTAGYLDPEYISFQYLTKKSDVYSFGVVLLELLSGRLPIDSTLPNRIDWNICDSIRSNLHDGNIDNVLDPLVRDTYLSVDSLWKVAETAMQCVEPKAIHRPTMTEVLQELRVALNIESNMPTNIHPTSNKLGVSPTSDYSSGYFDGSMNVPTAR